MQLQWEKTPHTTGKDVVADFHYQGVTCRYHVRRLAPHNRKFVALRDGRLFGKISYVSFEDAVSACEGDADSPKTAVKLTTLEAA